MNLDKKFNNKYNNNNTKKNHIDVKNNKGNWEFSFFQKKYDIEFEINTKLKLNPSNNFNPKLVSQYISILPSKENTLIEKNKIKKLKSSENLILQNYNNKKLKSIATDYENIRKLGMGAIPITGEGKAKLLLVMLDNQIKKGDEKLLLNIYYKLMDENIDITEELTLEYSKQLDYINIYISKIDIIKTQFTELYSQMPPLNINGFKKFDDWQIKVIDNIDKNISTLINAPTSAGKSVLSGYTSTKGKILFVVPTDALAWQMSAYIGNIIDENAPIVTSSYNSCPTRDSFIDILNKSKAIIGTPESIVDFLPFINNTFKWIIFDEIHTIGNPEGSAMEYILKILHDVPFLGLSATIQNNDQLIEWFKRITNKNVDKIICKKRFFNLQRYYYDTNLVPIRPISLIDKSQIKNKSLCNLILQPTPPDIWNLYEKLSVKFDLNDISPYKYFKKNDRITLDQANEYFNKLLEFMYTEYEVNEKSIIEFLKEYNYDSIINNENKKDIVNLTFDLKQKNNLPAIIFNCDTTDCLKTIRQYAIDINNKELEKYPTLYSDRLKQKYINKKLEKKGNRDAVETIDKDRKSQKEMMGNILLKKDTYNNQHILDKEPITINNISLYEPHPDFILNQVQYFREDLIKEWSERLKQYFPTEGDDYHYIIKLLWRGVGIYIDELPNQYLRLVQMLSCQKQLSVVFSDKSLIYGVSMPFRTAVIVYTPNLTPMIFQQMCGRAGRRGLDKEGNIIFYGFTWEQIKKFSTSMPPIINTNNNNIYTLMHANMLSNNNNNKQKWNNLFENTLDLNYNNLDQQYFLNDISKKFINEWKFSFVNEINHLHMNWKLRYSNDSIIISYIIPFLKRAFEDKDHTREINQINIAHFLCSFISIKESNDIQNNLNKYELLNTPPYNNIVNELKNISINIPENINKTIFIIIQNNKIIIDEKINENRENIFNFGKQIKNIQHYCYHMKIYGLCKILGKLLTRILWIYHSDSPLIKPLIDNN